MIITKEDTFSRKTKSSVKLTSELSISSSRNDEYMTPDIFKNSLLQMTESNITSNRGRARKKSINSMKQASNGPPSTANRSSCRLFRYNNEISSSIEQHSDLCGISVKSTTSKYRKKESICSSSEFESIVDTFRNNMKQGSPKQNNLKIIRGEKKENEKFYSEKYDSNVKQNHRLEYTLINDEEYSRRNFKFTTIQEKNDDTIRFHKKGTEQIIVYNVHCVESPKKKEKEISSNSTADFSCPRDCRNDVIPEEKKQKESHNLIYNEGTQQLGSQCMRLRSSKFKKPLIKNDDDKIKEHFPHPFPVTENFDGNLTLETLNLDSQYIGCNEDCFGTSFNKLFSNHGSHKTTPKNLDTTQTDFLTFSKINTLAADLNIPITPPSIQSMNSNFCNCCQYPNFFNAHQNHSHRLQGIPDHIHGSRCLNQGFRLCEPFLSAQNDVLEEKNINQNNTDNVTKLPENIFKTLLPSSDDISTKKENNDQMAANLIPTEKRKRHCTLCRTGIVDEDELSFNSTYNDVAEKIENNFTKNLNDIKDLQKRVNDNSINLKQVEESKVNNGESVQKTQNKGPSFFPENREFQVPPCRKTTNRSNKIPFQPYQNAKNAFCGCNQYLHYVDFNPKYLRRINKARTQGIPHNIKEHRRVHPKIESDKKNDTLDDCRCQIDDRGPSKEFSEPKKFIEKSEETTTTKNNSNTILPEKKTEQEISTRNEQTIKSVKPLEKKKRTCTLCRSVRADEGELSLSLMKQDNINVKTDLVPRVTDYVHGNQESDERNESLLNSKPITETTKSVGFDSKNVDIGRNITIQIIPNFAPSSNAYCDKQNEEPVSYASRKCIEDCASKSTKNTFSQNQIDIHIRTSEEHVNNQTHSSDLNRPTRMTRRDRYWKSQMKDRQNNKWWSCSWRRKKYPYPCDRNAHYRITPQDCCTSIDDISSEQDCQRVIPISENSRIVIMKNCSGKQNCSTKPYCSKHKSKEQNLLKYMHRLNKTIVQDLLATPCPSTSTAYMQTCTQNTQQTPVSSCADSLPYPCNLKSPTVNQCSQCEGIRGSATIVNENKAVYECLKQLTKKISYIENRFESDDEYENHSQDFNNCCCCCNRNARCCCCSNTVPRKSNKQIKPCTQSRSVEVIRSLKNCGTVTSKCCIQEHASTNTEIRPKMSKAVIRRKCRHCCRSSCCHCCRQTPCCPCLPDLDKELCDNTQIVSYQYESAIPRWKNDKIMYNCQCAHQIPFCKSELDLKKNISMDTKDTTTTEYQSVKSCQCNGAKSEVKSTNTTSTLEYAQITNDELIKSVTLDLCNLGDKTLSKFGVPSRQYPWSSKNFLSNMPNEIYRFIRTESYHIPITEPIYDPTPCLRPEILNITDKKNVSQDIDLIDMANKSGSPDAAGDIKESSSNKKKNLTSVCEAIFNNEQTGHDTIQSCVNLEWTTNRKLQFSCEKSLPQYIDSSKFLQKENSVQPNNNMIDYKNHQQFKQECRNEHADDDKHKIKFEDNILPQQQIDIKRNKSGIKLVNKKTLDSIHPKKDQKSKTFITIGSSSTYMPKPFTTKTGLMSFIPPFRDNFKSCTQVNKTKQKPPAGNSSRTNIKRIPIKKTRNNANVLPNLKIVTGEKEIQREKKSNRIDDCSIISNKECPLTNTIKSDNEEPETTITETDSETELEIQDSSTENQISKNMDNADYILTEKNNIENDSKLPENPIESNTLETETFEQAEKNDKKNVENQKIFLKFGEIFSFYDKCFKPSNDPKTVMSVPYFKTNVADIVKSLEFKKSSTTKSFLHSLVGSVVDTENPTETTLKSFLSEENIKKTENVVELPENDPFYENFFTKSSYQNAVQIPRKILSKTDLISLK